MFVWDSRVTVFTMTEPLGPLELILLLVLSLLTSENCLDFQRTPYGSYGLHSCPRKTGKQELKQATGLVMRTGRSFFGYEWLMALNYQIKVTSPKNVTD